MFAQACTPVTRLWDLHHTNPERYPFLLESTSGAHAQGCFDILFAFPGACLELQDSKLRGRDSDEHDFLSALDTWFANETQAQDNPYGLPFLGGWFFYLGYELAGQIEPSLALPSAQPILPMALAVRCPAAVVINRATQESFVVAECADLLQAIQSDLQQCYRYSPQTVPEVSIEEDDADLYLQQIAVVQEYIRAGDVFQVNLSRGWQARLSTKITPMDLYAALCAANPAPFSGLMCWRDAAVISSSPERLLRVENGYAQTRPIAGTRARVGIDDELDSSTTQDLLAHPKERAEHVMLIDLERNDLGRICEYGSVHVDELMTAESYAHVHHIVSNVRGKVRSGTGPGTALRAVFPGGTITGCPKVRCMQIIADLEGKGRGAYTGTMGYLGLDGRLDSNILIRTLVQHEQNIWLRAGGGIVADSQPQAELQETRAKARALLIALGATL